MHTPQGEVRFHTDKQGLPFINLNKSDEDAAILLVVLVEAQREEKNNEEHTREGTALVQMVQRGSQSKRCSKLKKQGKPKQCLRIQVKGLSGDGKEQQPDPELPHCMPGHI